MSLSDSKMDEIAQQFWKSARELHENTGIEVLNVQTASRLWGQDFCCNMGFNAKHMVDYLKAHPDPDGVRRLRELKCQIQRPGLGICDYDGNFITKWVRDHEDDLFKPHENLSERCLHQLVQDPLVYLNAKYDKEREGWVRSDYSQELCEEGRRANVHYGEDITWFWVGEY
jgi:hypothetical protein